MNELITKKDIEDLNERIKRLSNEGRKSRIDILEKIDKSTQIITATFSESRKIREDIGYQTIILKALEDNLNKIQIDNSIAVSSKIELSVGGEIFGTGAKWILDIDLSKANHKEILESIQLAPGIPDKLKEKAKLKVQNLCQPN